MSGLQLFSNQPQNLLRPPRRKRNIPHKPSLLLERDHNPGIFQKIERGAVAVTDGHKVNSCAAIFHDCGQFIELAIFDIVQWDCPREDAKFEFQFFWGEMNNKGSVVQRVEDKNDAKDCESDGETVPAAAVHAPEGKREEDEGQRDEEHLGFV